MYLNLSSALPCPLSLAWRIPAHSVSRHTRYGFVTVHYSASSWDPTASLTLSHPTLVLLEKCSSGAHFKQILAQMMRLHLVTHTFPMSRLLYFCSVSHPETLLSQAILLFNHFTPHPNLYIYRLMISALSFSQTHSIHLYTSMLASATTYPDQHTLLSLLKSSKSLSVGKQIHVHAIVTGFMPHAYLHNSLIKMYSQNGRMDLAQQVFAHMPNTDIVSYNIMISGYSAGKGHALQALELFRDAVVAASGIDRFTLVGLLACCRQLNSALLLGKSAHGWIIRRDSLRGWGLVLSNALLDMYAKCGEMKIALQVFDGLDDKDCISWNIIIAGFANIGELDLAFRFFDQAPNRDLVTWNSMLAGYARNGDCRAAMSLYESMLAENVRPDKVTAVAVVCVSAEMGDLNQGRCTHGWVVKLHGDSDAFVGSALIDMYSKCGSIGKALDVFEMVANRDIAVWTAMITGLAFHGHGIRALQLFWRMQEGGLMPNFVTLVAILTACSHAGLVDEGYEIFQSMNQSYGIEPGVEHYGCLVDLLARSGRLTEALDVIQRMPLKPSRSIWGAVLSASIAHEDMEHAEAALRELLKLEPEGGGGGYVLMSNLYAAFGRWTNSDQIREVMGGRGVKKMAGCSSVVVDGVVHDFVSSDKRHPRWGELWCMLHNLHIELRTGIEPGMVLTTSGTTTN